MDYDAPKKEATVTADQLPIVKNFGMRRVLREFPPSHYLVKVKSFSLFAKSEEEVYECGMFEAGGHKWKLLLYPKGNKTANGDGFISLYMEIVETDKLPATWEVYVIFKLFVLDQIQDKYLSVEDADGAVKRFFRLKTRCGFSRFLPMESFTEPANGYLMDDCCVFGAEVSVFQRNNMKVDCFSIIEPPFSAATLSWKIENFSKLDQEFYRSDVFTVEDLKWRLKVFPKGSRDARGKALSVFLELVSASELSTGQKQYAKFTLRVRNQAAKLHMTNETSLGFSSTVGDWGFVSLIRLKELSDASNGYIVNDTVIVEAEIHIIWKSESF